MEDRIWIVRAEFADRDDAIAAMDLLKELGVTSTLSHRAINTPVHNNWQNTRAGKAVIEFFHSKPPGTTVHYRDVAAALEEKDFKGDTASAMLTRLTRAGVTERVASGLYRLAKKEATDGN